MGKKSKEAVTNYVEVMTGSTEKAALSSSLHKTIADQFVLVAEAPLGPVHDALQARMQALESGLRAAEDSADLTTSVPVMKRLQLDLEGLSLEIQRYVDVSKQITPLQARLERTMADMNDTVSSLPDRSALRTLMDRRLHAAGVKARALAGPVAGLSDLVDKQQNLGDLCDDLAGISIDALQADVESYRALDTRLREQLAKDKAILSKKPPSVASFVQRAVVDDLEALLKPLDQIPDLQALGPALLALQGRDEVYHSGSKGFRAMLGAAERYRDTTTQVEGAHRRFAVVAKSLDDPMIGEALLTSLQDLAAKAKPLAELTAASLAQATADLQKLVGTLQDFDVQRFEKEARRYQEGMGVWISSFESKSAEVALLPRSSAKDVLEGLLAKCNAEAVPLSQITSLKDLKSGVAQIAAMEKSLPKIDLASAEQHQRETAQVGAKLEARISQLLRGLSGEAQQLLRAEFMTEFATLSAVNAVEDLALTQQKKTKLEALVKRAEERKIETGLLDKQRIKHGYLIAEGIRKRIAALETEALQAGDHAELLAETGQAALLEQAGQATQLKEATQAALDDLVDRFDKLSIGVTPSDMKDDVSLSDLEGNWSKVGLTGSERINVLNEAIKALQAALADPSGTGTQMLRLQGGKSFASDICKMHSTLAASGVRLEGISSVEALAVQCYTGNDYSAMNLNQRGLRTDERLAFLNRLCATALAKMPDYPEAGWPAFRSESAWSQDVVDKRYALQREFVTGVLWSTGARVEVELTGTNPKFLHLVYGKTGRDVAAISANPHEGGKQPKSRPFNPSAGRGEVLFPADSRFLVAGRTDPPGAPESIKYKATDNALIETQLRELSLD